MTKIIVRKEETIEEALRRFKRSVSRDGILAQVRKKEFYIKPSVERKNRRKNIKKKRY
ncbi:30S ribosomal protein S21 [Texas Phoenix palm phytoplasma]|uniref:Small ribosomal subunit protein bS21 n=1 Tax=Texas Phoenix palm phytoplasma TaxID=176709 RepID=A0ABS5BHY7_9MOLU|nr:30S ribosomal protein S21 [Texas Phoenix palm phytoplasma]MBP3059192.1 30S ribosomal protein S21 [Texas Phoenix palm phytoplasma]